MNIRSHSRARVDESTARRGWKPLPQLPGAHILRGDGRSSESDAECMPRGEIPLDSIVNHLYHFSMTDKQELIRSMFLRMRRIIEKHNRMDDQPFRLDDRIRMSPREVRAVEFIGRTAEANVTDLARHFNFTKSAASQLVSRLVEHGFVVKETAEHSDKELRLSLTLQGVKAHRLFDAIMRERRDTFFERTGAFPTEQIAAAAAVLEAIEGVVDDGVKRFE